MCKKKIILLSAVLYSMLFSSVVLATEETAAQAISGKPADAKYLFEAEVTGMNVYVRSGNSTADYPTMKLHKPDKVTVVAEENGWAKIVPPRGSYSWIYKAYVKIDPSNPTVGIVTGENVRVWAGADGIDAARSMGFQTKMNQDKENVDDDDIVELRPDQPEAGEYYKIKPPAGAYLWVSTEFLKYAGPYEQDTPIVIPPRPETVEVKEVTPVDEATQPSGQQPRPDFTSLGDGTTDSTSPVKVEVQQPQDAASGQPDVKPAVTHPRETECVRQCHDITAKIDAELKKPLDQQDYTAMKKELTAIQEDPDAGKAVTFAQILQDRITRYELAQNVTQLVQQQDADLEKMRQKIEKAHEAQLKKVPKGAKFIYTGTLKESAVYTGKGGPKRYIVADADGKIACYVEAGSPQIDAAIQKLVGQTVGINGGIVSTARSATAVISANVVEPIEP